MKNRSEIITRIIKKIIGKSENKDVCSVRGFVNVRVYENGSLRETIKGENLVVDIGRFWLTGWIAGAQPAYPVDTIGFGTSATAPVRSDTGLTSPFTKTVTSVSFPNASSVKFDWTLEDYENNGVTIQEFGLFMGGGADMFARRTGFSIAKTSSIRLEGDWTIQF